MIDATPWQQDLEMNNMAKSNKLFSALLSMSLVSSTLFYVLASKQLPVVSQEETGTSESPIKILSPAYLMVCNEQAGRAIYIAIAQREGSRWRSRGWWSPEQNKCLTIALGEYEGEVFYYAEDTVGHYWTSNNTFCINQQKAFGIPNSLRNSRNECPQGLAGVGMRPIRIGRGQTYTLRFN